MLLRKWRTVGSLPATKLSSKKKISGPVLLQEAELCRFQKEMYAYTEHPHPLPGLDSTCNQIGKHFYSETNEYSHLPR